VVLENSQRIESLPLAALGLESREQGAEVRLVLLGLGPVGAGEDLLLQRELGGAAQAEDAVVALARRQALEGQLDVFVFLRDEVVGAVSRPCQHFPTRKKGIDVTRGRERVIETY
jgi:hypothetical protein